jgi:MbtH protein
MSAEEDRELYRVVVNTEDQYVIWPANREIPYSWEDAGRTGGRVECMEHIWSIWTDMRPLSLRAPVEAGALFKVMINDDEQRAVWPVDRDDSGGWVEEEGPSRGTLSHCQEHVREIWTDMRPLSLRWRS